MSKARLGFGLAVAALTCACGESAPSAEEQCTELLVVICERVTVCTDELTDTKAPAGFESQCVKNVEKTASVCSKAAHVTSSYDDCIDQLEGVSCFKFLRLGSDNRISIGYFPAVCSGVIQIDLSEPPTGAQ